MRENHEDVLATIRDTGELKDDLAEKLSAALDAFAQVFRPASGGEAAA